MQKAGQDMYACKTILLMAAWLGCFQTAHCMDLIHSAQPCCNRPHFFGLPQCSYSNMSSKLRKHHSRVRSPDDVTGQAHAMLSDHIQLLDYQSDFTVIISVHDHGQVIGRNIAAILDVTHGIWQLVIVFDGCEDNSIDESRAVVQAHVRRYVELFNASLRDNGPDKHAETWECVLRQAVGRGLDRHAHYLSMNMSSVSTNHNFKNASHICLNSLLTEVSFIEQPSSVWETSSDNIGMAYSSPSKYFVLVQADMLISEPGWNLILSRPTEIFADVFSVSGRCAHSFPAGGDIAKYQGRCAEDIGVYLTPEQIETYQNRVFYLGTANRGPLLLRSDRLISLGLFDEQNFFLAYDDHDLMARALLKFNWLAVGYFALQFIMPYQDSTTRTQSEKIVSSRDEAFVAERKNRMSPESSRDLQRQAAMVTVEVTRELSNEDIHHVAEFWHHKLMYTLCCDSES